MSFRSIKPDAVQSQLVPTELEQFRPLGGYRGDLSAFEMDLSASPYLTDVRFRRSGIRRDFGWGPVGNSAAARTAGILDHYYDGGAGGIHYTLRVIAIPGVPPAYGTAPYYFDGANWNPFGVGTLLVNNAQLVSCVSMLNVFVWCHSDSEINCAPGLGLANTVLSASSPTARTIFSFGDRLLAVQADQDPQAMAWSADGVITDWTSVGSGVDSYLDTYGDALDELVCGSGLGYNTAALFRKRSIMRVFETGNLAHAIGTVPAIRGVGTEAPFSISSIGSYGILFLGSDWMVYVLTPQFELVPVGMPIVEELKNSGTVNRDLITSAYDWNTREWYLAVGANHPAHGNNAVYILDVGALLDYKEIRWRSRAISTYALGSPATAGGAPYLLSNGVMFEDSILVLQEIAESYTTKAGVAFTGRWRSPALNREGKVGTLRMLTLRYRNGTATTMTVKASGDGGATWTESKSVQLAVCTDEIKEVNISFDMVTGPHLCFQLELDTVTTVEIVGYRPRIAGRGGFEYA